MPEAAGPGRRPQTRAGGPRSENLAAAANLIARMDAQGVGKAMIMVVPSHGLSGEEDYRGLRDAVRRHPGRLYLMAGGATLGPMIRQTAPDAVTADIKRRFEERAEEVLRAGARGFGEMISYHLCMAKTHSFQEAPANHPLFLFLADIAAHPNLYLALRVEARLHQVGGGPPMPNRIVDGNMHVGPEWRALMEEFPDRLMIGGDEFISPTENLRMIAKSFSETWSIIGQLPPDLARKIGRDNAARVHGFD